MARSEQPLDRDGSPTRELAYWLRDVRRQSGLTVDQLVRRTGFSSSTLYDAFGGKQLPSQRVTLSIVEACDGDDEAWRSYWAQVRRALDRDAPDGLDRAVIPPWAAPATPPGDSKSSDSNDLVGGAVAADPGNALYEAADPLDHDDVTDQQHAPRRPRRLTRLAAIAGVVIVAAVSAATTALMVGRSPSQANGGNRMHPPLAVVIVQNKDAIGPSSLLEDGTPAYLSTKPIPRCRLQGCEVKGTDMKSGADLVVMCWVRAAEMTNENTTSAGIAHNPNGVTSTMWYRGVWPNGRSGYLSEVYIAPLYRGGLGLPRCSG
jgi:hypothetical protein